MPQESDLPNDLSTLIDLTRWRAQHKSDQRVFTFLVDGEIDERHLTYGELDQRARAIGAELQYLGAGGERVLLLYPPGLDYVAAFFGCLYAGAIAVPAYPPRRNRPNSRLHAIVVDCQAKFAVTTGQLFRSVKLEGRASHTPELETLRWLVADGLEFQKAASRVWHKDSTQVLECESISPELERHWKHPSVSHDTVAVLQYTSGSTTVPRGVMLTHANLLYNLAQIQRYFELTSESRGAVWLPPYHDMGLIGGILQPLYTAFPVTFMSPMAFLQKPFRWLEMISRTKATVSGGPNFAYDLCAHQISPQQCKTLDLSDWTLAFNGAEPVRAETLDRFVQAFESCGFRREAFYPCYGLAEATLLATGGSRAKPPMVRRFRETSLEEKQVVESSTEVEPTRVLVGCGQPLHGQRIVIVDPATMTQCTPNSVGEIWISGPSVAMGYWRRPKEMEPTFQAYLADTGDGPFLRTGDLGFLLETELFVAGRLKDLIVIRGRNYYPEDLELTAEQSHPALNPGAGAAFSVEVSGEERLVIVEEVKRSHRHVDVDEVARAVRSAMSEQYELQVYAVVLIKPGTISKTSSGKIQRHICREKYQRNELEELGQSIVGGTAMLSGRRHSPAGTLIHEAMKTIVDPASRHSILRLYLQELTAQILYLPPTELDVQRPLMTLGVGPTRLALLKLEVETSLGVTWPAATHAANSSINELATALLVQLTTIAAEGEGHVEIVK